MTADPSPSRVQRVFDYFPDLKYVHFGPDGRRQEESISLVFDSESNGILVHVSQRAVNKGGADVTAELVQYLERIDTPSQLGPQGGNVQIIVHAWRFKEAPSFVMANGVQQCDPSDSFAFATVSVEPRQGRRLTDRYDRVDWNIGADFYTIGPEGEQIGIGNYDCGILSSLVPGQAILQDTITTRNIYIDRIGSSDENDDETRAVTQGAWVTPLPALCEMFAAGKPVVVLDGTSRENEADIIIAAQHMTEQLMAWTVLNTSGVITVPILATRAQVLSLDLMVPDEESTESHGTKFTISVDKRQGTTTGISAADRALTVRALADENCTVADFRRPGHVFPLVYREGGVLIREGHTETSIDLCKLSGVKPCAAICELNRPDGTMMRRSEAIDFARRHGLPITTVGRVAKHVRAHGLPF